MTKAMYCIISMLNSSGVQVNIAEKNSSISASQVNNWATQEVVDNISKIEEEVSKIEYQELKENLTENLEIIKAESIKPDGKRFGTETYIEEYAFFSYNCCNVARFSSRYKNVS